MIRNIKNDYFYKYIANITFKQFSKWSFTIWFYNFIKNMGKRKKQDDTFLRKKTEKQQNSATIMTSVDGKGTVFTVKLELKGESFE